MNNSYTCLASNLNQSTSFLEQQPHPLNIQRIHVYNNSPKKITLLLGLLGYCETNATIYPTEERAFRINNILN